jgi:hypothetical protein
LVDIFARFGLQAQRVYNFVDVDQFVSRACRRSSPVSRRNFAPLYNVGVLRAFVLVQASVPDARSTVAGDGPQPAISRRSRGLGFET